MPDISHPICHVERSETSLAALARCQTRRLEILRSAQNDRKGAALLSNDRLLPAANFQLVTIRVLEEECIVAGTVIDTDFRSFKRFAARVADQFSQPIHFFACIRPKRDARAVWLMVFVLCKTEKFRRPVAAGSIKCMEIFARAFVNKPKLRQEFSVELSCHLHVLHP